MSLEKLRKVGELLVHKLSDQYTSIEFRENRYEILFTLKTGINLYIRYNTFGEYGYSIVFSNMKYDRIRYDNFDDQWAVSTRPHHKHLRGKKKAIESPMIGEPEKDMEYFVQELEKLLA